jgi:hypothetical protein
MTRETVYAGVFAYFSALTQGGSPLFKFATRDAQLWEGVAPEDCPAVLMMQRAETVQRPRGLPSKWTLNIDLYVYVHTGANNDPDIIPSQLFNPLIDAVEAALTVTDFPSNATTLGGLVSRIAIEGEIQITEGNQGDSAVAIIPIVVVVPTF